MQSRMPGQLGCAADSLQGSVFFPFTAASRLAFAEPGCNGFCWLSCGAQPDSQITSKVARMRPSASEKRSP